MSRSTTFLLCLFLGGAMVGCQTPLQSVRLGGRGLQSGGGSSHSGNASVPRHHDDAVSFGGHSYKVFSGGDSWRDRARQCELLGGYLACVDSGAEQTFIARLAEGRYLSLGGTDDGHEGQWRWINGSPWQFTAWMAGQPNNYGGHENCLATYTDGAWVDVDDEGSGFWMPTGYICEWDQ